MSKHRAGKWSTRKKVVLSIGLLIIYAVGFLGLYFYMESTKEEREEREVKKIAQEEARKVAQQEEALEEEVKELLTHFYKDEERSEINEAIDAKTHEAFNEKVEQIQDEELKQALNLEAAFAIVFMYAQEQVRNALNDEDYLKELTEEDFDSLEDAVLLAEVELPNFAEKIAPDVERVKEKYEQLQEENN